MKRDRQRQLSAGGGASKREVLFDPLSPALSHEGRGSELFYQHDAIGNVWLVLEQDGDDMELFCEFSQDAYGNPLVADGFVGSDWTTARAAGITEHETGKWIDPFSGLHFFHARWYDSETGRFISRDPVRQEGGDVYSLSKSNPAYFTDPTGMCIGCSSLDSGQVGGGCFSDHCVHLPKDEWIGCIIDAAAQKYLQYGPNYPVIVELCCRPMGGPAKSKEEAEVKEDCRNCHCYLRFCEEMDFGFHKNMDTIGTSFFGRGMIRIGYEGYGSCANCVVGAAEALRVAFEIDMAIDNPPAYGWSPVSPNPMTLNCQEWAEQVLEENGVVDCNYPWHPTY